MGPTILAREVGVGEWRVEAPASTDHHLAESQPEALGAAVDLARDAGGGTVRVLDMAGEEIASLPVGGRRRRR